MNRARLMFILLTAWALLGARPYEDTQKRFRIDLESGWELSPQFGDTRGMVFQKQIRSGQRRGVAILMIRAEPEEIGSLKEFIGSVEAGLASQPGFERISKRRRRIAGHQGQVRSYRMVFEVEPPVEKRIQAHFLSAAGHHYLIHVETEAIHQRRIRRPVKRMLASFEPLRGKKAEKKPVRRSDTRLVGQWTSAEGTTLLLSSDLTFRMAEIAGAYEVSSNTLVLHLPGGNRQTFTYQIDPNAQTLALSSPNLDRPVVYRKGGKTLEATPMHAGSSAPVSRSDLVGRWKTSAPGGPLVLDLQSNGKFIMGTARGKWAKDDDGLRLFKSLSEEITYEAAICDGRLILSGADLDRPVTFNRTEH